MPTGQTKESNVSKLFYIHTRDPKTGYGVHRAEGETPQAALDNFVRRRVDTCGRTPVAWSDITGVATPQASAKRMEALQVGRLIVDGKVQHPGMAAGPNTDYPEDEAKPLYAVHRDASFDDSFAFLGSFKSPVDGAMWDTYFSAKHRRVATVGKHDGCAWTAHLADAACVTPPGIAYIAAQEVKKRGLATPKGWDKIEADTPAAPPDTEPAKPALAYYAEQQAKARFDPFKGYFVDPEIGCEHEVTRYGTEPQDIRTGDPFGKFTSPDLGRPNPLHGSAALL